MVTPSGSPPRVNAVFQQFRFLHWFMAIGYGVILIVGLLLGNVFKDGAAHEGLYVIHSTLGLLAIASLIVRLFYLLRLSWQRYQRRLPTINAKWLQSVFLHTLLYLVMAAIPLTGIWLVNSFVSGNVAFLIWKLPDIFPENPDVGEIASEWHERLAYLIVVLTGIHLIAQRKSVQQLWKRWFRKGV